MSDRYVDFSDEQSKQDAQENPSQTQGESPRETLPPTPEQDAEYERYQQWKRDQNAPKTESVKTGRSVAPTEVSKSEAVKPEEKEEEKPQSYVWLANGEVVRANDEDLPGSAGHGNVHGFWEKDGKVHTIVAIHPVEVTKEKK